VPFIDNSILEHLETNSSRVLEPADWTQTCKGKCPDGTTPPESDPGVCVRPFSGETAEAGTAPYELNETTVCAVDGVWDGGLTMCSAARDSGRQFRR
ncbi:MAG: hypothetical protein ABGY42_01850, partial [bacterium]